jgi:hypothetical protein
VFGVDFGIEIDGFIDGGHEISRKGAKAQRKDSDCFGQFQSSCVVWHGLSQLSINRANND